MDDQGRLGETPMKPLELPSGLHTVTLVNRALGKSIQRVIDVKPGQLNVLALDMLKE
jgi:hypothetical protein